MKNNIVIILCLTLTSISLSQKTYFVSKDATGNFSSITQVNSASLNQGDIVSFKGGERFADAVLNCKPGVTYNSFGTGKAIIGDSLVNKTPEATIQVDAANVTITNLIIYGYRDESVVISYSQRGLTVNDCEIIGGLNSHDLWSNGIYAENSTSSIDMKIQRNRIHGFGQSAILWSRPYNTDISYNEMYDLWRSDAIMNLGTAGMSRRNAEDGNNPKDAWDCAYTVNVHHNNIHHFDYVALGAQSRIIYEYNEIHHNLDERIYRGGVKHGEIGKLWDNTGLEIGQLGLIFRYNYVHDLVRRGEKNYTYGVPTKSNRESGIPVIVSTNNGTGQAVYLNAGDGAGYGEHFGDALTEGPGTVIEGMGYGNIWIHNNIFYNCSNGIFSHGRTVYRGEGDEMAYDATKVSYFLNNTIINCGWRDYVNQDYGIIYSFDKSQSPQTIANNIIDYTLNNARYAIRWWEQGLYLGYNIYLNQNGTFNGVPSVGSNYAVALQYQASGTIPVNEQYLVSPSNVWNDRASTVFATNIGVSGAYIPDVRLKSDGTAYNTGKDFSTLGDAFTVKATYWQQKHILGQDPTGRSFAYDILGTLRTTNDIGAVGAVNLNTQSPISGLSVILEGPYSKGIMKTILNSSNLIPSEQPYNKNPWNINDKSVINNVAKNYVDWILIELRDNLANTNYSKAAILTEDGTVINSDGTPFSFSNIISGQYYIVIRHRNHLAIMSSAKINIENNKKINCNFTDSQSRAYGENAMSNLGDGKFAMIAGDVDANGMINNLDFSKIANNILFRGYAQGDTDMNGIMNVLDYSFVSKNMLKITHLP
jgi:hypothetical protein